MTSAIAVCELGDGYWRIPTGKLANATVWMETRRASPAPSVSTLSLRRIPTTNTSEVRAAYNRIGASWLWDRTSQLNQEPLCSPWASDDVLYFAYDGADRHVGLLELGHRRLDRDRGLREVEISYLGLFPELIGRGLGKQLLTSALELAWDFLPTRVYLHTCNTDHPAAYALYLAAGFVPYAAGVQIMDDPRLQGFLPKSAAPHVPLVDR